VLFSDEAVASEMNEGFECSWESVRKVPRVEIDFGDGRKLSRTLAGNVAFYFCTSAGEVFDLAPGVMTKDDFLSRIATAKKMAETIAKLDAASRKEAVARYHLEMRTRESATKKELERVARSVEAEPDMSKRQVEHRIKLAMKGAGELLVARSESAPDPDVGIATKMAVERPVKNALHDDTDYNHRERAPKIHALLAGGALEAPRVYTKRVYKEILDVDLDDPYLGLAPYVLGGEPGRHTP